jgi:PAS domain-containing protein
LVCDVPGRRADAFGRKETIMTPGKKNGKAKESKAAPVVAARVSKAPEVRGGTEDAKPGFPVVGIGASAGGLAAFEAFFSGMPPDTDPGMAFVLVQHLAPGHKSVLTELLGRYTRMPVSEAKDGVVVRPNHVYIIPPNRDMAFLGGALHLLEPTALRGLRLPIDFFFRSLAKDQCERAIGIVLSGTGSDGTLGVRAIKGEAGMNNILKMAREGLRRELITALHRAVSGKGIVRRPGLRVKTNGDFTTVNLTIRPVVTDPAETPELPLYLVILEEAPPSAPVKSDPPTVSGDPSSDADARIGALQKELRAKEEYLHAANEELETSNEELKSSNEEMQSVNEELATVNTELQTKVFDPSRINNDMNNLLAGTGIGTVFVDHQLRILRFTPATTQIINLILSDVGRPVGHIVSNLVGYDRLAADVQEVLDTLIPKEAEVQSRTGAWYMMRILPYRTLDNVIEGAVITFVDITEVKRSQDALQNAKDLNRLAVVVCDSSDAVTVQDLDGRILA